MGPTQRSLRRDQRGGTGCRVTALATITSTSGTRPATADMAKLVAPWQCTTARMRGTPVARTMVWTAAGWSYRAAWSSVHGLRGRSMLARQFSIQTS